MTVVVPAELLKDPEPLYTAVMVFVPTGSLRPLTVRVAIADPAVDARVPVPSEASFSRNATSPAGAAAEALTTAVSCTLPLLNGIVAGVAFTVVLVGVPLVQFVASLKTSMEPSPVARS